MLVEGLSDAVTADVRLGLLSATAAAELSRLQRCNQDEAAHAATSRGLTSRQVMRLVDALLGLGVADEVERARLLAPAAAPAEPATGGVTRRRTPGEHLAADAFAMRRLSVRLHARLLERSLVSLGAEAAELAALQLLELKGALTALGITLEQRLTEKELDARPE